MFERWPQLVGADPDAQEGSHIPWATTGYIKDAALLLRL
jgi:hypothetical protein